MNVICNIIFYSVGIQYIVSGIINNYIPVIMQNYNWSSNLTCKPLSIWDKNNDATQSKKKTWISLNLIILLE